VYAPTQTRSRVPGLGRRLLSEREYLFERGRERLPTVTLARSIFQDRVDWPGIVGSPDEGLG